MSTRQHPFGVFDHSFKFSLTLPGLGMTSACCYLQIVTYDGPFEIVSLVGTLSGGEGGHLHISLSDSKGKVIGGHVMGDLFINTTAEVVLGECEGVRFKREDDKETGYDELVVYAEQNQSS